MSFHDRRNKRGQGSRGRGTTIDFTKMREAVEFVEGSKTRAAETKTVADIEINWTPSDKKTLSTLPEGRQELYRVLRKCHKIKRFDLVTSELASNLLEATEKEVPVTKNGTQDMAICSYSESPHNFCLQWTAHEQRLYFLQNWIQDMIKYKKIDPFQTENDIGGSVVFAFRRSAESWARGVVTDGSFGSRASIYFMDYGDEESVDIEECYSVPPKIEKLAPMCFKASLENVTLPPNYTEFDWQTRDIFSSSILDAGDVECNITRTHPDFQGTKKYSVRLWRLGQDGRDNLDLGEVIHTNMMERLNIKVNNIPQDPCNPTFEELPYLLFENSEVNVHPYSVTSFKGVRSYRFLNIINPTEFYLEYVSESMSQKMKEWKNDLQNFYSDRKSIESFQIGTTRVFKNRCYVWREPENNIVHRVRVLDSSVGDGQSQVWLLDFGSQKVVNIKDMMELHPDFACWNAMAFKAHLADIKPTDGAQEWTEEASTFLKEMCCTDELYFGSTMSVVAGNEDSKSYGMVLVEKFTTPKCTVQSILVQNKFADGCGVSAGRHDLAYYLTGTPSYGQKSAGELSHAINLVNSKQEVGNSGLQAIKKKTAAEKAREEQILLRGNLLNGPEQRLQQVKGTRDVIINDFQRESSTDKGLLLEKMRRNLAYVRIPSAATEGLHRFYIQMQSKKDELERMMEDLEKVFDNSALIPEEEIVAGLIAAIQVLDDKAIPIWTRVVVKNYIKPIQHVKVILIDFGSESSAKISTLRYLPKMFEEIPPFCHRVHFDIFSSSPKSKVLMPISGQGWTQSANGLFKKFINNSNKKESCFYAWQFNPRRTVALEEFNQKLLYDGYTASWYADVPQQKADYAEINAKKEHPLLAHFFTSIGIDMVYETPSEFDLEFYKFVPVWKCLLKDHPD